MFYKGCFGRNLPYFGVRLGTPLEASKWVLQFFFEDSKFECIGFLFL